MNEDLRSYLVETLRDCLELAEQTGRPVTAAAVREALRRLRDEANPEGVT